MRLDQTPFVMPFLGPRIGEEDQDLFQGVIADLMLEYIDRVVAYDPDIGQSQRRQLPYQPADPRTMDLQYQVIVLPPGPRQSNNVLAGTGTDLQDLRRLSAKGQVEIQWFRPIVEAEGLPVPFNSMLLPRRDAALSEYVTADRTVSWLFRH